MESGASIEFQPIPEVGELFVAEIDRFGRDELDHLMRTYDGEVDIAHLGGRIEGPQNLRQRD
jgi:hypothetical protein